MNQLLTGKTGTYYILLIALAAMAIPLIYIENQALQYTNGAFAYPLDDPYIHLAVAKNLALYNVWGISPYEFSSASSSIIYPLILAGIFKVIGVHTIVPFIVNIVTGVAFLVVVQRWLARQEITPISQMVILVAAVFLIPLPLLIMCGMEHTLHLLFTFLFLTSFAEAMEKTSESEGLPWKVYLYGCLINAIRFESMSILLITCVMLLVQRRWKPALQLGFIGLLPILIFGIYSLSKGGDFLPNSVLIKSGVPALTISGITDYFNNAFGRRFFSSEAGYNQIGTQRLLLILPLTYLLFLQSIRLRPGYRYILILLFAISIFHVSFMIYSGWPRYEAYLIGCALVFCGALFGKYGPSLLLIFPLSGKIVACTLAGFILAPLFLRSWDSFEAAPLSVASIHDQQYEMGSFVHRYYNQEPVACNDIGAISYLSNGKNVDLWGLGNITVARSRRKHYDSPAFLENLCRQDSVKVAILFEAPFRSLVQHWKKIATWDIPYNKSSYTDSVSFYAVDPNEASPLAQHLKDYEAYLPGGVIVRYY